jgi:hypothetical protein
MLSIQSFYSQIERANPAARRLLWVVNFDAAGTILAIKKGMGW